MNIERLPKWAQEHIRKLENENASLARKLANVTGEIETAVEIDPHGEFRGQARRFIDRHASVRFKCGGLPRYIEVRLKNSGVDVFADPFGRESLVILPGASNHFHIAFAELVK